MTYRCTLCDAPSESCLDRCPSCGLSFGLVLEYSDGPAPPFSRARDARGKAPRPVRLPTGFDVWDRALSGGLTPGGSLVLYGVPGCRKTSWAAALADSLARSAESRALLVTAEMPFLLAQTVVSRMRRPERLKILGSDEDAGTLDKSLSEVLALRPVAVVYDSLQTFDAGAALAGSSAAILATVRAGRKFCQSLGHVALFVSHVNAEGLPAGPYRSIHDCDVVVELSLSRIRVLKNRFSDVPTPLEVAL